MVFGRRVSAVAGSGGDKANLTLCMSSLPPEAVKEFAKPLKKVEEEVRLYCSWAMACADTVLVFEKYVG